MKRLLLILLVLLQGSGLVQAQESDPDALSLMKAMKSKYEAYNNMLIDFELRIKDLDTDIEELKRGELIISGNKFRLDIDSQLIITDNATIWTYLQDVNEVQINYYEPEEEDFITPSKLFILDVREYYIILGVHMVEEGRKIQVIELSPLDKELSYHTIKLFVDEKAKTIVRGQILEKDGIHITYGINGFKTNVKLDQNSFKFLPANYPGIEIISLK
ncbi:MAG: outer membrane lipoprotein carrier protein [Limisphaerales bacterium]|jgi:outer membrane lipoprotein carrier protein